MLIIGIGGTTRPGSSSEVALRTALDGARACGADVRLFGASDLQLPLYDPTAPTRTDEAVALIDAITRADGVVISSPGYHGTVSGLVKNALDYVEDLASAERPYLTGLPVGCVSVAYGWQAAVNTKSATIRRDLPKSSPPAGTACRDRIGPEFPCSASPVYGRSPT